MKHYHLHLYEIHIFLLGENISSENIWIYTYITLGKNIITNYYSTLLLPHCYICHLTVTSYYIFYSYNLGIHKIYYTNLSYEVYYMYTKLWNLLHKYTKPITPNSICTLSSTVQNCSVYYKAYVATIVNVVMTNTYIIAKDSK